MNKNNIKYWYSDGKYHAEWSDRALDDDDRYESDSIIFAVSVNSVNDQRLDEKAVNTLMGIELDRWYKETR